MLIFEPQKVNLHTHSAYCRHGSGNLKEYVESAVASHLSVVGISEHAPVPTSRWQRSRMYMHELPQYFDELERLVDDTRIIVLKALECDFHPDYVQYYKDILHTYRCDYAIGAIHFIDMDNAKDIPLHKGPLSPKVLRVYAQQYCSMLESNVFLYGAHPDVIGCGYTKWDENIASCARDILSAAKALHIPLEINANGFRRAFPMGKFGPVRPYPLKNFWTLAAEYDIQVVIHSDAHRPKDIIANYTDCFALAKACGLTVHPLSIGEERIAGVRDVMYS